MPLLFGGTMLKLVLALCVFMFTQARALTWHELKIGKAVELTDDFDANKKFGGALLKCRIGDHAVFPKVKIGPNSNAEGVNARFFVVIWKSTDPISYSIDLVSDQIPCGCVLRLDQTLEAFSGA